jgi:ribosome maturation factor RimP
MAHLSNSDELWRELASIAADEGLLLYDLERAGSGALKVTIDRAKSTVCETERTESENGVSNGDQKNEKSTAMASTKVSSGDCSRFCRRLMTYFLVEGPRLGVSAEPEIEVSSPGVNRALRLPEHYSGAIGERVKISSVQPDAGIEKLPLTGVLQTADTEKIVLKDERSKEEVSLRISSIRKAQVDFAFNQLRR